ncbi:SigE family RNA polymerase sigma factor [Paractinoplanes rishiriensis]|uniref:RNA polymerase subunit sigma-24 n=1 Tax=Paractinoplanes rishiriensis TaxID=1050105 RepID=A0A919MR96_9ACTN|nr:SigE family RNA polymerase sigma factor [Actinoplanes rishiriensis]GIE96981.1 RNA polymerase subunit sigma-24 [Actinoplanes rishiriensis]
MRVTRFPGADFEAYVREVGPGLLRFGHVLTLDRGEAEDLAQETLIRVGLAWGRVRRDGNPVGYAQRTMVNLFLNGRRRRRAVPVAAVREDAREDAAIAAVDATSEVKDLLAALPPKQRAAVALRYLHDMPDEQIAELLGCSPPTVRSQVSRGLAALRANLPAEEGKP